MDFQRNFPSDDSRVWARQDDAADEQYQAGYEAGLKGWEKGGNNLEYNDGYVQGSKDAKKEIAISESILLEGNHAVDYAHGYEDARDGLPQNSDDPWYTAGFADFFEGIHDQYEALHQDGITNPPASAGPMEGKKLKLRKIIREAMGSDADALKQIKNREKMIGRGIDMGTMPYNPDWDYDTKPRDTYKPKSGFGHMKMIKPFFDEYDFDFKSKTSHDGRASLPIGKGGPDNGYFVQIEFDGSIYKMKWIKRERIKKPKRGGPYMNVSDWSETWEVEPTEKAIKTAVDEINYAITEDEAKGFEQ